MCSSLSKSAMSFLHLLIINLLCIGLFRSAITDSLVQLDRASSTLDWWENGNFYQIYPRSFKDSNGDGVGDLEGIRQKAAYLKELGMDGVWISPIMKSPMVDFGYDISDYRKSLNMEKSEAQGHWKQNDFKKPMNRFVIIGPNNDCMHACRAAGPRISRLREVHYYRAIDPIFGTMDDFDRLLQTFKEHGLHLILDFVPNHTSDQHEWFLKSAARDPEYENFYVWHPGRKNPDGGQPLPPNNWVSVFRFSAWEWHPQREQYYLHQFAKQQPDLNFREPKVVEAMKDVLRFWLNKGISGFRVDAVMFLFEVLPDSSGNYPGEPLSGDCDDPESHCYLIHIYTTGLNETYDMVYQWREVLEEFTDETRIIMTEAYASLDNINRYFGDGTRNGSHIPFNFEFLTKLTPSSRGKDVQQLAENVLNHLPTGRSTNWVLGNHDQKRLATRLGEDRVDMFNILLQTLPGIAITYQSEEIGMTDVYISWEDTVDPQACNTNETVYLDYSRDPARTPFQWDDSPNAGFTNGSKTWLPISDNYKSVNVKLQEESKHSHLEIFKKLVELKKTPAFKEGNYLATLTHDDDIFAYIRSKADEQYVIVLNFGESVKRINLREHFSHLRGTVSFVTGSLVLSDTPENQQLDVESITLDSRSGIVLKVNSAFVA